VSKVDVVIEKGMSKETEMYSAFKDPFKWQVSALKEKLVENGISDVFVVGLAGDYCVKDTAKDAAEEGWQGRTWIVEEGVKSVDPGSWDGVVKELKGKGVSVVKVAGEEVAKVRAL
jgi:nicotinamidase-related amidase